MSYCNSYNGEVIRLLVFFLVDVKRMGDCLSRGREPILSLSVLSSIACVLFKASLLSIYLSIYLSLSPSPPPLSLSLPPSLSFTRSITITYTLMHT